LRKTNFRFCLVLSTAAITLTIGNARRIGSSRLQRPNIGTPNRRTQKAMCDEIF
jgi:hypothetical protein